MPKINITELWLKHAHNHVDKPTEFTHEGIDLEFGVVVNPPSTRYKKGTKTFFTRYAFRGKRPRMSLGRYPTMRLAAALEEAKKIHRRASQGTDPRLGEKERREDLTFGELFELFYKDRSMKRIRPEVDRWTYERDLADWADRPAKEISRQDVREKARAICDRGAPGSANLAQTFVNTIFNYAVDEGLVDVNPAQRLPLLGKRQPRKRYLSDEEIRQLRPALRERDDWVGDLLHLMLLTGMRKAEVEKMRKEDLLDRCWWRIPGKLELASGRVVNGTKNAKTHLVYLAPATVEIVENRLREGDPDSPWVFPLTTDPTRCRISAHIYDEVKEIRKAVGSDDWGPHDLRRTVITNLARMRCPREIRMAIVNHTESHVHDQVYDQWERAEEKKLWLTRWADFLDEIEAGSVPQVLPLATQAA